jgi:hypothetical protein
VAYTKGIGGNLARPDRWAVKGLIESFNGKLRNEWLDPRWFEPLEKTKEVIET